MIDKMTPIGEVVAKYPETVKVFGDVGLGCAGCKAALFESIEQGARVHGIDVDRLLEGLNRVLPGD